MSWKLFGLVMTVICVTGAASADAPTVGRYVIYPEAKITAAGVPKIAAVLVDSATGRSWQLVSTKTGDKWSPILYVPVQMAGDGTPLMGGSITPK